MCEKRLSKPTSEGSPWHSDSGSAAEFNQFQRIRENSARVSKFFTEDAVFGPFSPLIRIGPAPICSGLATTYETVSRLFGSWLVHFEDESSLTAPDQSKLAWWADGVMLTETDFDVGVLLSSAVRLIGTSTFASGK